MPSTVPQIDVNCDMGEGYGRWTLGADSELVDEVTSANVACGFHAGDPRTIDATVALAAAAGVSIGAHVAYPDLVGFGRRHLAVAGEELIADVVFQIGALDALCHRHGTAVRHVKAHGALYNDLARDGALAVPFAEAVLAHRSPLPVLMLAHSPGLAALRDAGVEVVAEAFADRAYTADGRLVPRSHAGSVIEAPELAGDRAVRIAAGEPIEAIDGTPLTLRAGSLCVHGDSPGAVAIARAVRAGLGAAGVRVEAFT